MSSQISRYFFRILSIVTMGTIFLPVVFLNIPKPFGKTYFMGAIWVLSIILWHRKFLLSKYLLVVYVLLMTLLIGANTIWSDRMFGPEGSNISLTWIFQEVFGVFISILMYIYFIKSEDYYGLAIVSIISLIFILITSCTSIIGILSFPGSVRVMASTGTETENLMLMKIGIAAYGFFASLIFICPIFIYYLKDGDTKIFYKGLIIIGLILIFFSLIKSEFITALILSGISIFFSFFVKGSIKRTNIVLVFILLLVFIIFNNIVADTTRLIANLFPDSQLINSHLNDVANVIELGDFSPASKQTYFSSSRLYLSSISFDRFLANPIIGSGWGGGHATWIDRLGMFGLIGFLPWIIIFAQQFKLNISLLYDEFKSFYLLSFYGSVILGFLTTNANSYQAMASIFFLVPGLNYLNYLKKDYQYSD